MANTVTFFFVILSCFFYAILKEGSRVKIYMGKFLVFLLFYMFLFVSIGDVFFGKPAEDHGIYYFSLSALVVLTLYFSRLGKIEKRY